MGEIVRNQLRTECSLFPDESVPGTLFSIFSRHWKDLYMLSLMQLYQTCIQQSDTFKVDRDEADIILRDCIHKYKENSNRDLTDEEGRKITSSYIYASLRRAGWFIQEYDEADKSVYLWFPSYSAAFIRALNEMYKPSGITVGTYVKTITSALEGIIGGENDPWSLLLYARENAEKFIAAFLDIITETRQQLQQIRTEKDTGKMLRNLDRMLTEVTEGSLKQLYDEGLNDMVIVRIRKDLLQIRANQTILQEMENLQGILIATTNLTENLDKAFERRFLYKVKFSNPSVDVKCQIWNAMMPQLPEVDAHFLAEKFDFSGGQIENVVRKKTIQAILTGREPEMKDLLTFCCEEIISARSSRR